MLVVFPPIFVANTKISYGYDFVASLISKLLMSQSGTQTIAIHILPNISSSKDNPTMKFGPLIKSTTPRPYSEKSKLSISLAYYSKFYTVCF